MEKLKALFHKVVTRETILYVLFGVLTTLLNLVAFKAFDLILGPKFYLLSNCVAWVLAVAFSYATTKAFVFESKDWTVPVLKKEVPAFVGARIASLFLEEAGLWFFVEILHFDEKVFNFFVVQLGGKITAKLILGVIVVVINYVLSKFWIFKKKSS